MTAKAVYFGESNQTLGDRTKEHTRAVRAADIRRYETADHCWKYNHDFDWENKKIMDYEANTATRKIKETIHSLSNNNHINGIPYRLERKVGIFCLKGDGRSGPSVPLLPERNLTFWCT